MKDSTLVLLVNFGGPRTLDEVADFLKAMTGKEMPRAATEAVMDRYRAIGGGSPLAAITDEQASLLARRTGGRFPVSSAYCYSRPSLDERIDEACRTGVKRLVFFVMSPYCSSRTTGVYMETIEKCFDRLSYRPAVAFIHGWHNEPAFLDCWADRIGAEIPAGDSFYLFSAHSLPESLIHEPYKSQVEETVRAVATRLGLDKGRYAVGVAEYPAPHERAMDRPFRGERTRWPRSQGSFGHRGADRLRERPSGDHVRHGCRSPRLCAGTGSRVLQGPFPEYSRALHRSPRRHSRKVSRRRIMKVAIVGSGASALACAVRLKERGIDFTVFEKDSVPGGKLSTEKIGDFIVEGGPDSFLPEKHWTVDLIKEVGLEGELLPTNEEHKGTYIYSGGRLHRLPEGVMLMVPTMIMPLLRSSLISWPGKIRMGLELFVPKRTGVDEESLARFVTRRLGRECLDKIAEPLVAGIHTSNPDNMSVRAIFPRFLDMEQKHGSLIRAMTRAMKAPRPA